MNSFPCYIQNLQMMWHHLFPLCDRNMYNSTFSCAHNCICANQPSQSLTVFNEEHLMLLSFKEVLRLLRMKICLSSTFDLHFSFYQLSSEKYSPGLVSLTITSSSVKFTAHLAANLRNLQIVRPWLGNISQNIYTKLCYCHAFYY